jgi:protein-L-isoaspartate(D-aspartate) O-methyltransferase
MEDLIMHLSTDIQVARQKLLDSLSTATQDPLIINAFSRVPRHLFVPSDLHDLAYEDTSLPIGYGQTISQPSLLAYILNILRLSSNDHVLEVGSGSGYLAAILSQLVTSVDAIEIIPELVNRSIAVLKSLNIQNVHIECKDGAKGWPEHSLFDAIIFSARVRKLDPKIFDQLSPSGRLIAPIGDVNDTRLILFTRQNGRVTQKELIPVSFVPLVNDANLIY